MEWLFSQPAGPGSDLACHFNEEQSTLIFVSSAHQAYPGKVFKTAQTPPLPCRTLPVEIALSNLENRNEELPALPLGTNSCIQA
jgi:hypothetical protein